MTGKTYVFIEELADRLGADVEEVWQGLVDLDLAERRGPHGDVEPNAKAVKLGVWSGDWWDPGRKWSTEVLPQLGVVLRKTPTADPEEIAANKRARQRDRHLEHREMLRVSAITREQELARLTGFARVLRMIDERRPVLQAQYTEDEWREEQLRQHRTAIHMQEEHGFTSDYPDFESELWDRVIFTVDEQTVAAIRFELAGRATPAPVNRGNYVIA